MDYATAILPDRWYAAGRRLRPYTVGHATVLRRLGSPFDPGIARPVTVGDVALALYCCRKPQRPLTDALDSKRCVVPLLWLSLVALLRFTRTRAELRAYVTDAWTGPIVFQKQNNGQPSDSDTLRIVMSTLLGKIGLSDSEALALPLKRALWEVCGYWAQEGALRFANETELYYIRQHREAQA